MAKLQIQHLNLPEKYQNSKSEIDGAIQKQIYGGMIDHLILDIALATANTKLSRDLIAASLDDGTV